jgi:hypothetical protein
MLKSLAHEQVVLIDDFIWCIISLYGLEVESLVTFDLRNTLCFGYRHVPFPLIGRYLGGSAGAVDEDVL